MAPEGTGGPAFPYPGQMQARAAGLATQRPERSLAYLHGIDVERVKWLGGKRAAALRAKGIRSVTDLLFHTPARHVDRSQQAPLDQVEQGAESTVVGRVRNVSVKRLRRGRRRLVIVEANIVNDTGSVTAVWFNQQYQARRLESGAEVAISGKIERYRGRLQISSPALDVLSRGSENLAVGRVVPVYRAVGEAKPAVLRLGMHNALKRSRPIADPLPAAMRSRLRLVDRDQAISSVHFPDSVATIAPARRRLVFDEFFRLEVALAMTKRRKMETSVGISHSLDPEDDLVGRFVAGLPYRLTGAQERVIDEIRHDLASPCPMHRLLQGEVGSGKTVVAVATVLTGVAGGYQAAVMAPTEVLAEQHYEDISGLLADAGMAARPGGRTSLFDVPTAGIGDQGLRVGLLTGNRADLNSGRQGGTSRTALLRQVAAGEVDVLIGTHALIQEGIRFHRLGVAVVDEQHRFGVHQRVKLKDKAEGVDPDLLIMTATPIPRTLSMTLYGDLDVSLIDEMPPGRSPVRTWSASMNGEGVEKVWETVRREVGKGRQAFVVCPLVEGSENVEAASAVAEHKRLRKLLAGLRLGLLHGQMRPAEKKRVMETFRRGDLDVLVATTVIEVGIDVPNATVMVITDADRFGLSQLHQLRGRVGRGPSPSECILMADPSTADGAERIKAMVKLSDGFKLAEEDLRIRGHGTVFGARQSGFSDLRIGDILRDRHELVAARREAFQLVDQDPQLEAHPEIMEEVRALLGHRVEWLFRS